MKNFVKIRNIAKYNFALLLLISLAGVILFQAQNFKPLSGDNDPRFDQPTNKYLTTFHPPKQLNQTDVVTSADGYDNFDVSTDYAEQNIVTNPMNPLQFFFGVNGSGGLNNHYSTNGGLNWSVGTISYTAPYCDPWTAADSVGNLFYSYLATTSANYINKSTNFGASFSSGVYAVSCGDRNSIAVDFTGGPYSGYVYATGWSPCNFARSTDHGVSYTTTVSGVSNTTPGNMICIGPSPNGLVQGGSVYWVTITGSNPAPSTFNFYRSTDGGATMSVMSTSAISPGYVGTLNTQSRLVINNARTRPYPMIAADNSYGPYRGRLYCVYASNVPAGSGNKPDIKLQYSTNGGSSWSAEIIVNDTPSPTTSDQWFPAIWCEKTTGKLYCKWYDTRANPSSYQTDVYASYSTNGGVNWVTSQRLTNASWTYPCPACSPNSNCYMGDYDGITANPKVGFAVWYDGRNCTYANMSSYFPDYAVKLNPTVDSLRATGGDITIKMVIPSVKLYTDTVLISANITPTPSVGTLTITYPNSQILAHFPDSLKIRIQAAGGVTAGTYTLNVTTKGPNGTPVHIRTATIYVGNLVTGITSNIIPAEYYLYQNYPNPFNPTTKIVFDMVKSSDVKISIFDIAGKKVDVIEVGKQDIGRHSVTFNGENLSSGVYFYKIQAGEFTDIKKMFLVK
jgi:hypothetical protein